MDADERDICNYLKSWPGQFVGMSEICRRAAGKKRFRDDPNWAVPAMNRLVEKGVVESDATGHYRLPRAEKKQKKKRWVSPQIKRILEASGKNFEGVFEIEQDEPADD
jgi:hypothetical protein